MRQATRHQRVRLAEKGEWELSGGFENNPIRQPYILRYFFDYNICLWAGNKKARQEFGYNVELEDLPLSLETLYKGKQLIYIWDSVLHWGSGQANWTHEQCQQENQRFRAAALDYLKTLQNELGHRFIINNELDIFDDSHSI